MWILNQQRTRLEEGYLLLYEDNWKNGVQQEAVEAIGIYIVK